MISLATRNWTTSRYDVVDGNISMRTSEARMLLYEQLLPEIPRQLCELSPPVTTVRRRSEADSPRPSQCF
uniref:Transposase n=1 Tax=Angiostrongylus cantonensis TaxID=6313 RepID=A0A0K0DIJ2_ANGCA